MLLRLIFAFALIVIGVVSYRWWIARQMRRTTALALTDPLLSSIEQGVPTILYFTTPMCIPCKTQQAPALERLQRELPGAVQVVRVDATEQPEAAQRWGVFSAPTTFVLDRNGKTLAVNYGVAEAEKLRQQLQASA